MALGLSLRPRSSICSIFLPTQQADPDGPILLLRPLPQIRIAVDVVNLLNKVGKDRLDLVRVEGEKAHLAVKDGRNLLRLGVL